MVKIDELLKDKIKQHVVLRDYTHLKVGGVVDYFYEAEDINQLITAVKAADQTKTPYFILGEGANIIFSDFGFPGIVIKNKAQNISYMEENSQIIAESGVSLQKLIVGAASNELSGLEALFGIPGTVGGAIYNNTFSFGQQISDFIKSITLLSKVDGEMQVIQIDAKDFEFAYHSSFLKNQKGYFKPVILAARIQLAKSRKEDILRRLAAYKKERFINEPVEENSCKVFSDPIDLDIIKYSYFKKDCIVVLPKEKTAHHFLQKSQVQKIKVGEIKIYKNNFNFLINDKNSKAMEFSEIIAKMQDQVLEKTKTQLTPMIEYCGQW